MADIIEFPVKLARRKMPPLTPDQQRLGNLLFKKFNQRLPKTASDKAEVREMVHECMAILAKTWRERGDSND